MKPKWEDAPKWAKWLAMDDNGMWWWYSQKPAQMQTAAQGRRDQEQAVSGWKPIETAPKDGTSVLLTDGQDIALAKWTPLIPERTEGVYGHGYWAWFAEVPAGWNTAKGPRLINLETPTYWMPLPDPPEQAP